MQETQERGGDAVLCSVPWNFTLTLAAWQSIERGAAMGHRTLDGDVYSPCHVYPGVWTFPGVSRPEAAGASDLGRGVTQDQAPPFPKSTCSQVSSTVEEMQLQVWTTSTTEDVLSLADYCNLCRVVPYLNLYKEYP
ncbi:hypothetical protein SKAU_G00278540 [Synaphobranchus kaupii]|uniref:Uncharacterized protein n=1 Tax=Synaphobranchus kaupii TaxID=118154 RepID=A0A9Q1EWS6_SYNKA|nr:hypothetical protein SKAU_G00278540 [Synaphobranchus kaupii]